MRSTISIPDPLLENAKQYAKNRGATLSEVLEDSLRRLLAENPPSRAGRLKLHTVRGKLVNRNLDLDRTSDLIVTEDETAFRER